MNRRSFVFVAAGGMAPLSGCGFNSRTSRQHEFILNPYDGSSFDCGGNAFRLTGDESHFRIDGQLPPTDQTCHDITGGVYWSPEGLTLIVEVRTKKNGILSRCTGTRRPVQYTLTAPIEIEGHPRFALRHFHEGELRYEYARTMENISLPVEKSDC